MYIHNLRVQHSFTNQALHRSREMDRLEEEPREQLTESEIKSVKKELRALQKEAEGLFLSLIRRCGCTDDTRHAFLLDDNTDASKMTAQELAAKIAVSDKLFNRCKFSSKSSSLGRPLTCDSVTRTVKYAQKNSSLAVIDSKIMAMHSETAMKIGKQARAEANAFEPGDFFEP